MHLFAQAFAPRKLGENTTQGGMWWSDLSYPLFGENTTTGNQTELSIRTINWILVPQRWCYGGWDRLEDTYCWEAQLFSHTLDPRWVGVEISLSGTKCFQTISVRHGIRWNLEGERRSFFSLCSQKWGTWRMRCGGGWRFQLGWWRCFSLPWPPHHHCVTHSVAESCSRVNMRPKTSHSYWT